MIVVVVKLVCYILGSVMIGLLAAALAGRAAQHAKGG